MVNGLKLLLFMTGVLIEVFKLAIDTLCIQFDNDWLLMNTNVRVFKHAQNNGATQITVSSLCVHIEWRFMIVLYRPHV